MQAGPAQQGTEPVNGQPVTDQRPGQEMNDCVDTANNSKGEPGW